MRRLVTTGAQRRAPGRAAAAVGATEGVIRAVNAILERAIFPIWWEVESGFFLFLVDRSLEYKRRIRVVAHVNILHFGPTER